MLRSVEKCILKNRKNKRGPDEKMGKILSNDRLARMSEQVHREAWGERRERGH